MLEISRRASKKSWKQGVQIIIHEFDDTLDGQVCRWTGCDDFWIQRVMSLARKNSSQSFPPCFFHRSQNVQLVIDHDVVTCRIALLHIIEHLLLVDVDQYTSFDGFPQPRALHFARLKNHVAVGQDYRGAPLSKMFDHVQGSRIQPV